MMVDRAKFDTLLGLLGGYVGELRRLAAIPRGQLLADPDKVASAKRPASEILIHAGIAARWPLTHSLNGLDFGTAPPKLDFTPLVG